MGFGVPRKELIYKRVNPESKKQIKELSDLEKEGFGTDFGSVEFSSVLKFITRNGYSWMQYIFEDGRYKPTGVIELIPLKKALRYNSRNIKDDLSNSPFTIALNNQRTVFKDARRFAEDKDIIFHHAISMSKSKRGNGYGTMLLKYALENTPDAKNSTIICFVDAAKLNVESKNLELLPNENSYALHLRAGFFLVGIAEPSIYDNATTYYSFVRFGDSHHCRFDEKNKKKLKLTDKTKVEKMLKRIKRLTSTGYVGVDYDKNTHLMTFKKLKL